MCAPSGARARSSRTRQRMPGARFFADARLNFAAEPAALTTTSSRRSSSATSAARAAALCLPRAARGSRAHRRGPQGGGRRRRRPRGRLRAEPAGSGHRDARHGEHRCDLVIVLAGLRRARRARSLRADRAQGAVHRRRLFLRRQDARFAAADGGSAREAPEHRARGGDPVSRSASRSSAHSAARPRVPGCGSSSARPAPRRTSRSCPSTIRSTSCIPPGTTGVPKCIVHGAGGTLLQHQKEHLLHTDLKRSDRLFYFTTCGWMMWNWLMSALATGRDAGALRRQPVPSRTRGTVAHGAGGAPHRLRHQREVSLLAAEERLRPGDRRSISPRCARCSPPARRCCRRGSTTSTARSRPTCSSPRSPAAPTSSRASRSAVRHGRCIAARSSAAVSAWRSMSSTRRAGRCAERAASWSAPRPSPRCRWDSGTIRRARSTGPPTSSASRACGTTATMPRSPSTMAS